MKDEEMAEEYANGYATPDLECSFRAHMFEASKDGFLAGLKAGIPQWHDLRKDPNDLPKGYAENTKFLCSVKGETLSSPFPLANSPIFARLTVKVFEKLIIVVEFFL